MKKLLLLLFLIPNLVMAECPTWNDGTLKQPCNTQTYKKRVTPFDHQLEPQCERRGGLVFCKPLIAETFSDDGGYDPSKEPEQENVILPIIPSKMKIIGKQKEALKFKIKFKRDITSNESDIHELRFTEYNFGLKDDGSDFWPKDELTKDCSEISEKFFMSIQPVKTGLNYKYIANNRKASRADMEVTKLAKWKNAGLNVKVSQFNEHSIMATEITANYRIYKYRSSIPIVDVTIEECTEVKLDGLTIDFSKAKKVSTQWFPFDKKEQLWITGLWPPIKIEEGIVDLRGNLGSAKSNSMSEVIIECQQPNCPENLKQTIFLDLKSAKKAYEIKKNEIAKAEEKRQKELDKIAKQNELDRIQWEKEATKEAEKERVKWEEHVKKAQKEMAIKDKKQALKKLRDTPLSKLSDKEKKAKIADSKQQCLSLGFKPETSKLRKCIMELM
jgi:hypothetical protein